MKSTNYQSGFSMHHKASENIQARAKELRRNMTEAEKILWSKLRNNQLLGMKFRRQHPIDIYIVDFYCHEAKLVIEADGKIHLKAEQQEYDRNRSFDLKQLGITELRFSNVEIKNETAQVIEKIKTILLEMSTEK